jgi:diguanylate cyclase (GGDEF)-like protein
VTWVANTRAGPRGAFLPARLAVSTSRPCWSGPGRGLTRPGHVPRRRASPEHLLRLTPAVLVAAVALDVLVALAPVLLPSARGDAVVLSFLALPSVAVAGWGSRRWISAQSMVVVAGCGVGVLTAVDPSVPTAVTAIAVTAAILAAARVVVVLRRALERAASEARAHAILDPLTAAVNRRGLENAAVALLHDGRRRAQTVGAIMIDVDDFKAINDAFGHQAGDRVLKEVCAAIRSCVRSDDIVARLGGEEFAVLTVLPPLDLAELGERIRRRVAERCGNLAVTVSLGVTWADPAASHPHRDLQGLWQLIDRADALMYLAKRQGRDQVCLDRASG